MGVASEFDEEEGPLEEHIQRLTDSEKQIEVLKAALEAEKKKSASGDFCQIEKCKRHVDLWCDACETPLCYRCSTKIVCEAAEKHSLEEFDVIYKDVKREFDKWRYNQEEMFVLLEFRQKKMMENIRGKERELSEASGESLSERADRLVEIADLMRKLEPLSLQVEALKTNLTTYGEDVDKLSKPEYLYVVKSVVDQTVSTVSVSSYPPIAKSTAHLNVTTTTAQPPVTKTPAQPPVTKTPAQPTVTKTPAQPPVTKTPAQPPVTKSAAQPPVTKTPAQPLVTKTPAQPPVTKTPAQPLVTKTPAQPTVTKTPAQPRSLQLISKYDTDHSCWSVYHHSITGDILVGYDKGVKIISRQSGEITRLADYPNAVIREHKGEVFISSRDNKTINIYRFNMNNKTDELLFSYSSYYTPYMSVSDHHIVNREYYNNNNIKLYNRVSGTVCSVKLPGLSSIYNLQFLPDETLLVTGYGYYLIDRLNKYRLSDEGEPTLIWSCDDVEGDGGVSVADNELIFVCGYNKKTIYIVSSEGKKVSDIKCEELPGWCNDISIRGDELAVAGGSSKGVLVYNII